MNKQSLLEKIIHSLFGGFHRNPYLNETSILLIIIILAITYMLCLKPRFNFKSCLFINLAVVTLALAFFVGLQTHSSFELENQQFSFFGTADIYSNIYSNTWLLSLASICLGSCTILFLVKVWYLTIKRTTSKDKFSLCILILLTCTMLKPLRTIYIISVYVKTEREENIIVQTRKVNETEKQTTRYVKDSPNYWGSHFLRAQFLAETTKGYLAIPHYKRTLKLLDKNNKNDQKMIAYIKKRLVEVTRDK